MTVNILRGTLVVAASGEYLSLAELATVPDIAKGFGIPAEARINHIGVTQNYDPHRASADLSIGWEIPS